MSNVIQAGTVNTNQLLAPGVYVQILPPSQTLINGVPTNIIGVVGTAKWGPKNSPVTVGSLQDYVQKFGPVQINKYDMGTVVDAATQNFANNFRCVRVTDGTDAAATVNILDTLPATGLTLTARYTGSVGNTLVARVMNGSAVGTYKIIIGLPNGQPEIFDNISGSGNALWVNMAAAINQGQSSIQGPSQLVVATAGAATAAPAINTYTLSGGTDGISGVTATTLIGLDVVPRTGMYALRNTQASIVVLADDDDSTTYTTQVSYGLSEGSYMILVGPAGQTVAQAQTAIQSAGIDSYTFKFMIGDWINYFDRTNNRTRLVSPQGFIAGRLANLSPARSSLNQGILGIIATQTSQQNKIYTSADIIQMAESRLDVIAKPSPGGNYFATQTGQNGSSNALINDDGYTRSTNFIAYTLVAGLGNFIGQLQTPDVRLQAKNTIQSFLQNLEDQGMIGDVNGGPAYKVVLDVSNNPSNRVAQGYMQADVQIVDFRTIRVFLVNLQNGQVTLQPNS